MSAGLMLAARERGERVVVVTATRGEHGTDDPRQWPPDRLGAHRARELERSLAVLGVDEHRWLGHSDGGCATVPAEAAVEVLAGIVDEVAPDTIVTFGPDGFTGHADHRTVAGWTRRARHTAAPEATLLEAVMPPRFTDRFATINDAFGVFMDQPATETAPDLQLRLRGEQLDRKMAALCAQDSQTRRLIDGVGPEVFRRWWAQEAFLVHTPVRELAAA